MTPTTAGPEAGAPGTALVGNVNIIVPDEPGVPRRLIGQDHGDDEQ
jgi:hypothetical protein